MIELNCIKSLNGANGKFDLDANFNVKKGEFVALYGKSGSGVVERDTTESKRQVLGSRRALCKCRGAKQQQGQE